MTKPTPGIFKAIGLVQLAIESELFDVLPSSSVQARNPDRSMPRLTALICTRNRPHQIREAVRSLLVDADDSMELLVMDQSSEDASEQALAPWRRDPRLTYHRTRTAGKGVALNEGLRLARAPIIVLTDDDCIAPPGWAQEMASILDARPRAAVVFCNVKAVPHDRSRGYVPTYERTDNRLVKSLWDLRAGLGLGAGMAVRRRVALSLGGFDEAFGPGALFPSADEWDFAIRALIAGWQLYESADLTIVHDGFRSYSEGREHAVRDWVALGAVSAKPLRGGHPTAAAIPLCFYPRKALWPPLRDLLALRRPRGLLRITAYLRGMAQGLAYPMDAQSLKFRPKR